MRDAFRINSMLNAIEMGAIGFNGAIDQIHHHHFGKLSPNFFIKFHQGETLDLIKNEGFDGVDD